MLSTRQWLLSPSAPTGLNLHWPVCSLVPDLHRQASIESMQATSPTIHPVADCWQDTHRSCNKEGNASHVQCGGDNNNSPCFLCNLKNTLEQLCILIDNRGGERLSLGCSRLLGVLTALGRPDQLQLCVMQMLHHWGFRVWSTQTSLL